jgi:cytidyltransferase-like protein
MGKIYDTGLICGRFQTFHKGHQKLVETGLLLCDRLIIVVGSAQEAGTTRNPLNISTRMDMIRSVYDDSNIMIYSLADMTNENDICPEWGKYLLNSVDRYIYKAPEIMIYGNDESRSRWFDAEDIKHTSELIVNRHELPISATMLRDLMALDLRRMWMGYVDPKLHKMYDRLRNELMTVPYYKQVENEYMEILLAGNKTTWGQKADPLLVDRYDEIKEALCIK